MKSIAQRLIEIMDRTHNPESFEMPEKTWEPSYGGGDCSKHGRYYGRCFSCQRDSEMHYDQQYEDFLSQKMRDLQILANEARKEVAL